MSCNKTHVEGFFCVCVKGVQEEVSQGGRWETILWKQEWEKISKNKNFKIYSYLNCVVF